MTDDTPITEPDKTFTYDGVHTARWGKDIGAPLDPVPSVYASDLPGREIDLHDLRLSLDVAAAYAARIVNAVRWQRARNDDQRAAELTAMATGDAATHDWKPDTSGAALCARCHTLVRGDDLLGAGAVPVCGTPCSSSWHEIGAALSGQPGEAVCLFCDSVYVAGELYVLFDRDGRYLAQGPFLTFERADEISRVAPRFVPMKFPRDEAVAAVTAAIAAAQRLDTNQGETQ